jgi:hypothetical protein
MRKTIAALAVFLYISALLLTVSAQTSRPSADAQDSDVIGGLIGVIGLVVVFAVIGYAGYRMIKKWSSSQPD